MMQSSQSRDAKSTRRNDSDGKTFKKSRLNERIYSKMSKCLSSVSQVESLAVADAKPSKPSNTNSTEEKVLKCITAPLMTCAQLVAAASTQAAIKAIDDQERKQEPNTRLSPFSGEGDQVHGENGFALAVSLHDAIALYVSGSIENALGYPRDMLTGQCILNYLYPRDRLTFASNLSQALQSRFSISAAPLDDILVFYVRIRQYKSVKSGLNIADKTPIYKPFQLRCCTKDMMLRKEGASTGDDETDNTKQSGQTMCLMVSATPVQSAHKLSEECTPAMIPFSTRHTSSCHFSHVDTSSIPYLGYLPQDIVGYSVFDFYHNDDLTLLRDIYELVAREQGSSFRSKPYRFKVFNGDFLTLETEWSCFINPWSRKFEFIVGQHRILCGPINPNVFDEILEPSVILENNTERKKLQAEILHILSQPVRRPCHDISGMRRKRRLAAFVSDIIDGNMPASPKECSCSDLGSVVMGEISPHREDSQPSTETPPSFQEMRLNDNIERFFASQPKTNCAPSSEGSSSTTTQNQSSPDGSGSNDGSGSSSQNQKKASGSSLADSAFQSGSCGDGTANGSNNKDGANKPTEADPTPRVTSAFALTEEIMSHHDAHQNRTNFRQHRGRQPNHQAAKQAQPENAKAKRTCHSPDKHKNKSTAKKQQRLQEDSRARMSSQEPRRCADRAPNPTQSAIPQQLGMGVPFFMNPSFWQSSVSSQPGAARGSDPNQMMMPVMCFGAIPMPVFPDAQVPDAWAPFDKRRVPSKRNVKLQTDWPIEMEAKTEKKKESQDRGAKFKKELKKMSEEGSSTSFSPSSCFKSDEMFSSEMRSSDSGSGGDDGARGRSIGVHLREPPWMEGVDFSDEIAFRYQTAAPDLNYILKRDMAQGHKQPELVRKQLAQLTHELESGPAHSADGPTKSKIGFDVLEADVNEEMEKREQSMLNFIEGDNNL